MSNDESRGARAHVIPLPEALRLKRAIESLSAGIRVNRSPGKHHPRGERGEAAQFLGVLKALVEQIEEGLRGGELQADVDRGRLTGYERSASAMLTAEASRSFSLAQFAEHNIDRLPCAYQQMAVTALALRVAGHGFAASAEIAMGLDSDRFDAGEAARQSAAMYDAADELTRYVSQTRDLADDGDAQTDR
ncbi:hypothetical protein OIU91_03800 [Streptomyces sp. NBC_01456]|uniref:hypothetical protein n=1 Tax=unclassified Streptomyces TaxID=2593676 RepID=UPI002E378A49|nr:MULTISPECIES: hypothetical protein [unclassified Streptomyces]